MAPVASSGAAEGVILAPPPSAARVAVGTIFFANGAAGGNWFVRIPAVQEHLGLSAGTLGAALLSVAVGALATMPVAGALSARVGSRRVTTAATLLLCALLPFLALAPTLPTFVLVLVAFGAANGAMDVAMNAEGVAVEKVYQRPIMSTFHGLFSVGGMVGAASGGLAAARDLPPVAHLLVVGLALGLIGLVASRWLLPRASAAAPVGPSFQRPTRTLLGLGIVAFCVMLGEGAMSDWSAVYLHGTLGTSEGLAAAGYSAFSLMMAAGRLSGDRLALRFGPVALVRLGGALAAGGLALATTTSLPWLALVGFGCTGAGLSVVAPMMYSAAGRSAEMPPGPAIATVTTLGYLGFLVGPPAIGATAEAIGLRGGLGLVAVLSVTVVALAPNARAASWVPAADARSNRVA